MTLVNKFVFQHVFTVIQREVPELVSIKEQKSLRTEYNESAFPTAPEASWEREGEKSWAGYEVDNFFDFSTGILSYSVMLVNMSSRGSQPT